MTRKFVVGVVALFIAASANAQAPQIGVEEVSCLPIAENQVVTANVQPEIPGASVRLYFRRLNPFGDFYYVEMDAQGSGAYWATFPKPEDREQRRFNENDDYDNRDNDNRDDEDDDRWVSDEWWPKLESRDWMADHDREWLEEWLEELENEASEYYVAVYDARGKALSRSKLRVTEVYEDCPTGLSAVQDGYSENMTVGETVVAQEGHQVYHWLCDGIVTRVDVDGILRADEICRACVIALWPAATVMPLVAGTAIVAGSIIEDEPPEASPSRP